MSSASPTSVRPATTDSRRKRLSRSAQNRKAVSPRRPTHSRGSSRAPVGNEPSLVAEESGGRPELNLGGGDDDGDERKPRRVWPFLRVFVEKKYLRQFFRVSAFVNVLSLILSAPFLACSEKEKGRCDALFWWFVVITCIDFILSVVNTLQAIARIEYAVYLHVRKEQTPETGEYTYTAWYRLLNLILVTVGLWWSVAIGIVRSVKEYNGEDAIESYLYLPVVFRSLAVFNTIQLFLNVQVPLSVKELLGNIKWKQLGYVAVYYLFFLYIYALMGVQWLGGLGHRCVYIDSDNNDTPVLAVPLTHCNPTSSDYDKQCYGDSLRSDIDCQVFPSGSGPLDLNFRNQVYFGQFRFIIDAVFAVYEATSLELWSFFSYTAADGAPSPVNLVAIYYFTMVFYLVIFVQQSIFLVVIIESFADLRSARAIGSAPKPKDKPLIVLTEQASATDLSDRLKLQTQRAEESVQFAKSLDKWYHHRAEKVFLLLVFIDAIITALKYTDICNGLALTLQVWQLLVSFAFVCEIGGLVIFHLANTNQHSLFLRNPYYWYLSVLAIGGLVAAMPFRQFYDPRVANSGLAIFQAARLPRLLRSFKTVKHFFYKIVGDGTRLLVVILLTLIFLVFFAVINVQLFGYVESSSQCRKGHFDNFLLALQSMFQLIMQEGWSEVMSEVMCHSPVWIVINFYFIILHLIASLILLNFFVAVILDNLDLDEEKKKEKLQQVVEKKTVRKVPAHLYLLTACGPKLISAPKISTAGVEVPNLTEADMKNFYETGENKDMKEAAVYSTEQFAFPHQQSAPTGTLQRQSSELSQLQLLSVDSNVSTVSSHHEKFQVIQSILESVRWLRKQNRDQEGRRPVLEGGLRGGLFAGGRTFQDTSQPTEDEYDRYRAKYRLFDSALFMMPPDHRLRRLCKTILTYQMSEPLLIKTRLTPINLLKHIFSYYGRYLVSRLPYFTWLMVVVTLSAILVQMEELRTEFDKGKVEPSYLWVADFLFVLFTLVELTLKILANGFFLNPDAAIRSLWDVMDWVVVVSSAVVLIINTVTCGPSYQTIVFTHLPLYLQIFLCLRALRPLRTISLVPQMRRVLADVVLGWKQFLRGGLVLFFALFMFASLGVQLFAGNYPQGPQAFCNDPSQDNLVDCLNRSMVNLQVYTSRELLPNPDHNPTIMVPTVWYTHRRDFSFDNTPRAMLTMFQVLTLEGWLDVRDMLMNDPATPGIPSTKEAWYMAIFLHIFIFLGVNIGLQLFVGIVVNNFNAHKPGNSALLSVAQKRWTDLMLRISLLRPIKRPPQPSHNRFRLFLYKIVIHRRYRNFSTAIIIFQSFCFSIPWNTGSNQLPTRVMALMILVILFAIYFILEECVKLLAFGPKGFVSSWRNILDALLSLQALCYIMWAAVVLSSGNVDSIASLSNFALIFAVLRCFTILGKYSIMQNLSITVVRTLIGSTPLMCVLFFIIMTYSFIGNIIFSNLRTGEGINFSRVNFDGPFTSFHLAIRVMTGEDWHHLLWDSMIGQHYCSKLDGNCGSVVAAIVWFISYYLLITVILINIVIAHLLENFSIFYNEDDTRLSHAFIKDYKQNWLHFDKRAQGTIKASQIKLFLRTLRLQNYYTYSLSENSGIKLKVRDQVPLLTDPLILREMAEELQRGPQGGAGGERAKPESGNHLSEEVEEEEDHSFQSVLKMLAYRAEDISQRLEPQELYDRQEFEESIQFDVAEECILKWIKKFVRPVLKQQEGQASVEEQVRRNPPPPRMDSMWTQPLDDCVQLSADTDDEGEEYMSSLFSRTPLIMRRMLGSPSVPTSEDLPEPPTLTEDKRKDHQSHEEQLVAQSYSRLAQMSLTPFTQGGGPGGEDRWHDWFRMQRKWSEQVDNSNPNYFDDGL